MSSGFVRGVRASAAEWDSWAAAAGSAGLSLNGWLRRAGRDAAELEAALARRRAAEELERDRLKARLRGETI